jgi:glyoxylase-like metal-dependent hydrolase (beta-lactamase superfamily II)
MALKAAVVPVTPFQQNCTILWDDVTLEAVVVDPGGEVAHIIKTLEHMKLQLTTILLTHGHMDHAGGADELRELTGAPVVGPDQRDAFLLAGLAEQGAKYGIEGSRNVTPDRWLVEGETVRIGQEAFSVLHCPGHTPGHVVFVNPGMRVALVGDVLFRGSVGRTDFPYGDGASLIEAITTKLLPLGDDISFLCGHGPGGTFGVERQTNPFLRG